MNAPGTVPWGTVVALCVVWRSCDTFDQDLFSGSTFSLAVLCFAVSSFPSFDTFGSAALMAQLDFVALLTCYPPTFYNAGYMYDDVFLLS